MVPEADLSGRGGGGGGGVEGAHTPFQSLEPLSFGFLSLSMPPPIPRPKSEYWGNIAV